MAEYLRLVKTTESKPEDLAPEDLAFVANELYVYIAAHMPDSQFKENMLAHVVNERSALIKQVVDKCQGNDNGLKQPTL